MAPPSNLRVTVMRLTSAMAHSQIRANVGGAVFPLFFRERVRQRGRDVPSGGRQCFAIHSAAAAITAGSMRPGMPYSAPVDGPSVGKKR